jgi:hypothetical protein
VPSEENVTNVVIALGAQRLADRGIVDIMDAIASETLSVVAVCAAVAARMAGSGSADSMDWTKAGCGERDEQLRMIDHRSRDPVVPTAEASVNELPNVPGVQIRT